MTNIHIQVNDYIEEVTRNSVLEEKENSYLNNEGGVNGGIPSLVEGNNGQFVPGGEFIHLNPAMPETSVPKAEFDTLQHKYNSAMEYIKELEGKIGNMVQRMNILENSVGSGI